MNQHTSFRDQRHIDKTMYLGHSRLFYESTLDHYKPKDELITCLDALISDTDLEWRSGRDGVWTHVTPVHTDGSVQRLPSQGWKIHISATNQNALEILEKAGKILVAAGVSFKFANDLETLTLMTSKRWSRGGSGKFMTIYPKDDSTFLTVIEELYVGLKGFSGSYILSDRRYKDSRCVYYRYGGILPIRLPTVTGLPKMVIQAPDGAEYVDERKPYYNPPPWAVDPCEEWEVEDEGDDLTLNNGRFTVEKALSFSNTGGVYLAFDNELQKQVVLKEARPGVELSKAGNDAVQRLQQEERILKQFSGQGVVPEFYTSFHDWENYYIAIEFLDADILRGIMLDKSPLLSIWPDEKESQEYYDLYVKIFVAVLSAVDKFHAEGVVVGDLSPINIMVGREDNSVRLIDMEGAFSPAKGEMEDLHTPGFRPYKEGETDAAGFGSDLFAVGAIMLYSMFPVAAMSFVRSDLFETVLPYLIGDIGWSGTNVEEVIRGLVSNEMDCQTAISLLEADVVVAPTFSQPLPRIFDRNSALALPVIRDRLSEFLTANYRLDEKYTLFPIDPFGADTNPLGFGFGSCGIISSMRHLGVEVPEEALARHRKEVSEVDVDSLPPGLLVGTAGMAWTMFDDGELEDAKRFLEAANRSELIRSHHSLYYGKAGIGLTNLRAFLATGDGAYLDHAKRLGEELKASAEHDDRGIYWSAEGAISLGYAYGQSGVALFLLRLSEATKDSSWREFGEAALRYDLSYAHELEPGISSFAGEPETTDTYEPYIEVGTAGIAKVALRYGLDIEFDALLANLNRKYAGFPGLIYGLAGFVDVLIDAYRYTGDEKYLSWAERPLRGIYDLYLFRSKKGYAIPGENLFRVTCDYATGIAGFIITLQRRIDLAPDRYCLDEVFGEAQD